MASLSLTGGKQCSTRKSACFLAVGVVFSGELHGIGISDGSLVYVPPYMTPGPATPISNLCPWAKMAATHVQRAIEGETGGPRPHTHTHTPDVQHYLFSCLSIFLMVEVKHCLMEQLAKQNSHLNDELWNLWNCGPWLFLVSIGFRHWLKLNTSSWKMLCSWLLLVLSNSDHSLQLLSILTFKHSLQD